MSCMGLHLSNLLPHASMQQGCEQVWRQRTNEYGSKWTSDLIGRRRYTIGESMGIPSKKESWCGFIPQQHHEASVENYTNHGLGLTKSPTSSLMSPTASKMYEHTGNVLWYTLTGLSGARLTCACQTKCVQNLPNKTNNIPPKTLGQIFN